MYVKPPAPPYKQGYMQCCVNIGGNTPSNPPKWIWQYVKPIGTAAIG